MYVYFERIQKVNDEFSIFAIHFRE